MTPLGIMDGYWLPFGWGLLVLLSFLGWGTALERTVLRTGADWGLRCGWGIAVTITIGGILAALSLASRPALIILVGAGAAIGLWDFAYQGILRSRAGLFGAAGVGALIVLWYAPVVSFPWRNGCDDDIAYFTFVRRLLDSGTLLEPFSLRRLATYGGQSVLQALIGAMGSQQNLYLLDIGIGGIVLAGIVYGACRRLHLEQRYAVLIAGAALLFPVPRMNSMSQTTGLVLFLTLFLTIQSAFRTGFRGRDITLIGMLSAAIATMRDNYIPAAILATLFYFVIDPGTGRLRARIMRGAWVCLAALLFLLPWMILLEHSSGSWLYPVIRGNQQQSFMTNSAGQSRPDLIAIVGGFFTYFDTLILLVPAILFAWSARSRMAFAQIAAGTLTAALTAFLFTSTNTENLFRYAHAYLGAALLASLFIAIGSRGDGAFRRGYSAHLFAIAGAVLMVAGLPRLVFGQYEYLQCLRRLPSQINHITPYYSQADRDAYRRLQSVVPPGAKVLAVTTAPSLFSYRQNSVLNVDTPGACSPSPGMPFFKGPSALKEYLRDQRIGYIAYSDFDAEQCLYYRPAWRCQTDPAKCAVPDIPAFCGGGTVHPARRSVQPNYPGSVAPFYLDLMENIDRLAATEDVLVCNGNLRLLRLK